MLLVGLMVSLAGSFADNVLGGGVIVAVLQVVLWSAGGVLLLAGAASSCALGAGHRAERGHQRADAGLHPTA